MKQQLKNIERGTTLPFAGHEWIALEHTAAGTTLVLMAENLEDRAFDTNNNADWRQSSARKYLNGPFLDNLKDTLGDRAGCLLEATVDLTADDGTFRETCTDTVFLLSCDQYRRNRDILEPTGDWWWTLTRWSASNSCLVRFVYTDGALSHGRASTAAAAFAPLCSCPLISDSTEPSEDTVLELAKACAEAGIPLETAVGWIRTILSSLAKEEKEDDDE